jgi:hypothetical protein
MVKAAVRFGNEPAAAADWPQAETMTAGGLSFLQDLRPGIYAQRNAHFRRRKKGAP